MKRREKGFTLIELLAVIVVLGIILAIAIPRITETINNSRKATFENSKKMMLRVAKDYIQINGDDYGDTSDGILSYGHLIEKGKLKSGIKDEKGREIDGGTTLIDTINNRVEVLSQELTEKQNILSTNFYGFPLSDYRIYGNSTQEPDPTPSSPKEVISLGETNNQIEVVTSGKNLFNALTGRTVRSAGSASNTSKRSFDGKSVYVGLTIDNWYVPPNIEEYNIVSDNEISIKVKNAGYGLALDYHVQPEEIYKVYNSLNLPIGAGFYTEEGEFLNYTWILDGSITIPSNCYWMTVIIRPNPSAELVTYSNIQLEKASNSTSYEPYKEQKTTIDLTGHDPLRKIGDVADYIDYKSGKIVRNVGKYIVTGQEVVAVGSTNETEIWRRYLEIPDIAVSPVNNSEVPNILCTDYIAVSNGESYKRSEGISIDSITTTCTKFGIFDSRFTDNSAMAFNSWLAEQYTAGTPVIVYYQLAEPDDSETINLPQISTYNGINNIRVSGGGSISAITY